MYSIRNGHDASWCPSGTLSLPTSEPVSVQSIQNRKLFSENECFISTFRSLLVPVNPKDVKSFAYQCTTSQYGDYDCVRHWDYQSRQGKRFNGAVAKPETDENSA